LDKSRLAGASRLFLFKAYSFAYNGYAITWGACPDLRLSETRQGLPGELDFELGSTQSNEIGVDGISAVVFELFG